MAPPKETDMTEMTTMTMAVHRAAMLESQHPVHALAYDLALEKRRDRRARWRQLRTRLSLTGRREPVLGSGC